MASETLAICGAEGNAREGEGRRARAQSFGLGLVLWAGLWAAIVGGSIWVGDLASGFDPLTWLAGLWPGA